MEKTLFFVTVELCMYTVLPLFVETFETHLFKCNKFISANFWMIKNSICNKSSNGFMKTNNSIMGIISKISGKFLVHTSPMIFP